jgi:hypothetical protein
MILAFPVSTLFFSLTLYVHMYACMHGIEIFHEKPKMCVRCLIAGGVTTMEPFLKKFIPSVLEKMGDAK